MRFAVTPMYVVPFRLLARMYTAGDFVILDAPSCNVVPSLLDFRVRFIVPFLKRSVGPAVRG